MTIWPPANQNVSGKIGKSKSKFAGDSHCHLAICGQRKYGRCCKGDKFAKTAAKVAGGSLHYFSSSLLYRSDCRWGWASYPYWWSHLHLSRHGFAWKQSLWRNKSYTNSSYLILHLHFLVIHTRWCYHCMRSHISPVYRILELCEASLCRSLA